MIINLCYKCVGDHHLPILFGVGSAMRAVIIFALLVGVAFAAPKNPTRIVGGTPTTVDQYPYMANMQYMWLIWWMQFCGGSLISNNLVLSAAHCYYGDSASEWRVRLGTSMASSGGTIFNVAQLIVHPQYEDATADHDVALVRLSSSAIFSNVIQAARIPGTSYDVNDGATVTTVGWGSLTSGGNYPEQLQHVDINVINWQLCYERYEYLKTQPGFENFPYTVTENMICAGILDVGGKDACQGDSGGPLSHDGDVIVGIVSWGFRCAEAHYPGVNARVNKYTDWIVANSV